MFRCGIRGCGKIAGSILDRAAFRVIHALSSDQRAMWFEQKYALVEKEHSQLRVTFHVLHEGLEAPTEDRLPSLTLDFRKMSVLHEYIGRNR